MCLHNNDNMRNFFMSSKNIHPTKMDKKNYMMMVAGVLMEESVMPLVAVKGIEGYVRLAFNPRLKHMRENLCVIRPIALGRGVKIEFEMSPNASMTGLVPKDRVVQIMFDDDTNGLPYDRLFIKTALNKKKKAYEQVNQKNNMAGLVSLALYREKLLVLRHDDEQ
jgi:hypothetical protein